MNKKIWQTMTQLLHHLVPGKFEEYLQIPNRFICMNNLKNKMQFFNIICTVLKIEY